MKVIVTGATGFVGSEVLASLLARPDISAVTCLARRAAEVEDARVSTILLKDFTRYDEALIEALADHDACIWTLGGKAADIVDPAAHRRITYDFTLALAGSLAPRCRQRLVFCYLSGMGADPTETAWFPWEKLTRHLKGRTERDLQSVAARFPDFQVRCFRPGGILPRGSSRLLHGLLAPIVVGVDVLAASLIRVALDPRFEVAGPVISNRQIKRIAAGDLTV